MKVGGRNLNMLLDTGDDFSMLSYRVASEMGLRIRHAAMNSFYYIAVGPAALTLTDFTLARGMQLGNLTGDGDYEYGIRPEATTPGYDGSLGVAFLRDYDVDFDYRNLKFNLFSKDHCPGGVVYWTKDPVAVISGTKYGNGLASYLVFDVQLDGKPIEAYIDTSLPRTFMDWSEAKSMFGLDESNPNVKSENIGGGPDRVIYKYPFKTLSFGGVTVNNPDIELQPSTVSTSNDTHRYPLVVIGADILHQLHIYIANGEGKLYVTPASAH
jgi:hypothetical protein